MTTAQALSPSVLYEQDETAWLEAMSELIRLGRLDGVDYPNLAEYLADMARRDRREVECRLTGLLALALKRVHQPDCRTGGWRGTIIEQRQELEGLVSRGVLRNHADAVLADVYRKAIVRTAAETGMPVETFPWRARIASTNCCPPTCSLSDAERLDQLPGRLCGSEKGVNRCRKRYYNSPN